ncbi:MAG: hypothetical protein JO249_11550 [Acidobacteria bacterium]|nr:hypothetical protein [Acidobacteriota bacterium]
MRLPEKMARAEQTIDITYDSAAETGSTDANGVCVGDTAKGEGFCGYAGQPVLLMNNPGWPLSILVGVSQITLMG